MNIHHKNLRRKTTLFRGFTLVEVLVASTIFAAVGLIAVMVFVNILRIQQRISIENAMYEDARFMMERISREIRRNTLDYEEYYNKVFNKPYGTTYGCYASRFYNPGVGPGPGNGDFGALCNDDTDASLPNNANCVINQLTLDKNTGLNPYEANPFNEKYPDASAFCDKYFAPGIDLNCGGVNQANHNLQKELYLINPQGTEKTILALKEMTVGPNSEHAVALLRLTGEDEDQDNIIEQWSSCKKDINNPFCCSEGFNCPPSLPAGKKGPLESTLLFNPLDTYEGFVPISPSRTDVVSLNFYVAPLEDPRKAFAEDTPDIQQQPHITVILTVQPSKSVLQNYKNVVPTLTLQTTLSSRVYHEVKSFYKKGVCEKYL